MIVLFGFKHTLQEVIKHNHGNTAAVSFPLCVSPGASSSLFPSLSRSLIHQWSTNIQLSSLEYPRLVAAAYWKYGAWKTAARALVAEGSPDSQGLRTANQTARPLEHRPAWYPAALTFGGLLMCLFFRLRVAAKLPSPPPPLAACLFYNLISSSVFLPSCVCFSCVFLRAWNSRCLLRRVHRTPSPHCQPVIRKEPGVSPTEPGGTLLPSARLSSCALTQLHRKQTHALKHTYYSPSVALSSHRSLLLVASDIPQHLIPLNVHQILRR